MIYRRGKNKHLNHFWKRMHLLQWKLKRIPLIMKQFVLMIIILD